MGRNEDPGDYIYTYVMKTLTETEENRRFSAFFDLFDETFQVSPLEPLLTAPYRAVRTSNRRDKTNPNVRRIGCPAPDGETHEALFQVFRPAVSSDASRLLLAIQYYVLRFVIAIDSTIVRSWRSCAGQGTTWSIFNRLLSQLVDFHAVPRFGSTFTYPW